MLQRWYREASWAAERRARAVSEAGADAYMLRHKEWFDQRVAECRKHATMEAFNACVGEASKAVMDERGR